LVYYAAVKTWLDGKTRHRLVASMGAMTTQHTAWTLDLVEVRERSERETVLGGGAIDFYVLMVHIALVLILEML
jgi:hypothetical protein